MKKVVIVEDQKIIRSILEGHINEMEGFHVARAMGGAQEGCEFCCDNLIHLILMGVRTSHRENGLAAAVKIKKSCPKTKILIITSLADEDVLRQAKRIGADGLWYKDTDGQTLTKIITKVMDGERVFPDAPPVVEIGTAKSVEFTKTELKVLRHLVKGLPYHKIAEKLSMEEVTVKYHVTNMLQKTNLKNKLQLAVAVSEAKFVTDLAEFDEEN